MLPTSAQAEPHAEELRIGVAVAYGKRQIYSRRITLKDRYIVRE
jgi:hypothetical protein